MNSPAMFKALAALVFLSLAGCSSHSAHRDSQADNDGAQSQEDLIPVIAALHDQMHSWQGTPYQWGGTQLSGVDCSGFVWRTLKDRFNIPMDRVTTRELIQMGERVQPDHMQPGDLVFFRINHELHVGFYDTDQQFLHASASRGVMRSSLNNPYWKSVFIQARRLHREYNSEITLNKTT
ncbi:C40 family peptidase [Pantoea cypripedii]|jgi:probable lipoprotein NlpC|uniref:NlpC n=1 Tax=Pantoea cypripedii TaxID=55209 RepID=A0A6B9G2G5_PANCY|nr:NlpC/P60 family protein [Pantoea cypripedii]QGY31644.1 NlpC [Pantoea cypripedii]